MVEVLDLEIAEIGGNVIFLLPEDASVFYGAKEIRDIRVGLVTVVSDVQLILDLYNVTDRTREAAERILVKKYEGKLQEENLILMVKEFLGARGLITDRTRSAESQYGPDLIFCNPKTTELIAVEIKSSMAKLDSVDKLKKTVLRLGSGVKGVLVAPSITDAAMKELDKANLQFEPVEAMESGIHKATS
jgi:RecB family endonuclease NucS